MNTPEKTDLNFDEAKKRRERFWGAAKEAAIDLIRVKEHVGRMIGRCELIQEITGRAE